MTIASALRRVAPRPARRPPPFLTRLARERRGVALIEFALILPVFLFTLFATFEIANMTMTIIKVQRLANMSADMVSQNGVGGNQLSEIQMYDILDAMNVSASPLDMEERGRIVLTGVLGIDNNNDGISDRNRILWQRFGGGLTSTAPALGCWSTRVDTTLPSGRNLAPDEMFYHAQVSYAYEPIFSGDLLNWMNVPTTITRMGGYRGRTSSYRSILATEGYPAKSDCDG